MAPGRVPSRGFTLVELVVVIVITAIIGSSIAAFIARPMGAYVAVARRAALVEEADGALRRIARDVRRALPNSLRVGDGGRALELIHTADGGAYRAAPGSGHTQDSDWLDLGAPDGAFNVLAGLVALAPGDDLSGMRIAIGTSDTTELYDDAAAGASPGVITPASTSLALGADGDEAQLMLDTPFRFRRGSPRQRMYLADGPVIYLCDPGAGTLTRHDGHPVSASFVRPAPAAGARLSVRVEDCAFEYGPGTATRAAVVTLTLVLEEAGERVRLLHQVHVENAP